MSAKAKTKPAGAVAEYERLLAELERLHMRSDEVNVNRVRIAQAQRQAEADLVQAHLDLAMDTDGAEERVSELRQLIRQLEDDLDDNTRRGEALDKVRRQTERAIELLLKRHPEEFVAYAAPLSEKAEAAIGKLREAWKDACAALGEAETAWRPVTVETGLGNLNFADGNSVGEAIERLTTRPEHLRDVENLTGVALVSYQNTGGGRLTWPADHPMARTYVTISGWDLVHGTPEDRED